MEIEEIIEKGQRIVNKIEDGPNRNASAAEALEFLRIFAGENSTFFIKLRDQPLRSSSEELDYPHKFLLGYLNFLRNGLRTDTLSLKRQAEIDVVSDYLDQAQTLLSENRTHHAAPCVLIGASLEEFLRNWVESIGEYESILKPSISTYASKLKALELLTKQDIKNITNWSGYRNSAAHGQFDEFTKEEVRIMLSGVNLFIANHQ